MRALTLYQPYASLVGIGAKTIETRSWGTSYRGPLLIHAAKRWDDQIAEDCRRCMEVLKAFDWPESPIGLLPWKETLGRVLAVVRLADCRQSVDESIWSKLNRTFGDLSPGRYAWCLADVRQVAPPVPWRGNRGLWEVPADLMRAVGLDWPDDDGLFAEALDRKERP